MYCKGDVCHVLLTIILLVFLLFSLEFYARKCLVQYFYCLLFIVSDACVCVCVCAFGLARVLFVSTSLELYVVQCDSVHTLPLNAGHVTK